MCRESYPDIDQHNIDIDTVEKEWPKFHEQSGQTIAQEPVTWGAERIGRMPPFTWDDGATIRTSNGSHDGRIAESYADCLSAQPYAIAGGLSAEVPARRTGAHTFAIAGGVCVCWV